MNKDHLIEEGEENFGLPDNWRAVDSAPIIPGQNHGGPPAPPLAPGNYFAGTLPSSLQHDADFVRTGYRSSQADSVSLMPVAPGGQPSNNASIQKVIETTVVNGTATPGGPDGAIQSNSNGLFYGDSGLTYDKTTQSVVVAGDASIGGSFVISGGIVIGGSISASSFINSAVGFRIGGSAIAANYLRGNGTNFISAVLSGNDVAAGKVGLMFGGTNSDLSATGGTSQVLQQSSSGAAITVGQLSFSNISGTASAGQIPNLDAAKITTGQLALARGGTNADLSATGGTSQVLKQISSGAAVTVAQLAASDLSNGTTGTTSVVLSSSPTVTTPKWTAFIVASLPSGSEGQYAYATDGRKVGEGPGTGTGVPVYFSNSQWRVFSTDAQVQA